MKVTILSHASGNCFQRAYYLAHALQQFCTVEVIGLVDQSGVWTPFETSGLPLRTVPFRTYPLFVKSARELLSALSGDVIYAIRALPATYGIALLKKSATGVPVVLDMDDWELGLCRGGRHPVLNSLLQLHRPDSYPYVWLTERFIRRADAITSISSFLVDRFGGTKLPHCRDAGWLDPARYDRAEFRRKWGLDQQRVIVWFGTPAPHKGLDDLIAATALLERDNVRLVIVGVDRQERFLARVDARAHRFLTVVGPQPHTELPRFLAAADLVVLPQRRSAITQAQMPAKLYEAMAMARPIIGTNVGDIPEALAGCGLVVEPENPRQLAAAMAELLDDEARSAALGQLAREKCIREYSVEAMTRTLAGVLAGFM